MKSLYKRLALSQIKRNKNIFIPFIVTIIFLMVLDSICLSIRFDKTISGQKGMDTMNIFMSMAVEILSIFSLIMLSSVYSFIQKRKLKESGLYLVLGLEKRHLKIILFWEVIYTIIFSIIPGLILSILLYKISLAIFIKNVGLQINVFANGIFDNIIPALCIAIIFIIVLILIFVIQVLKLNRYTPIKLINETKAGDKKSKFRTIIALIGILSIGFGYWISITTKNPMAAFQNFFIAVLLVIIGTYCAFSVIVSIVLEILKNKKSYYKTENFFAISGLLYRVKRNSRSLSSIAILSTAFIIILTSGLSLYFGIGDAVSRMFPSNLTIKTETIASEDEFNIYSKNINNFIKDDKFDGKVTTTVEWSVPIFNEKNKIRKINKDEINKMLFEDKFKVLNIYYTKDTKLDFKDSDLIYFKDDNVRSFIDSLGYKTQEINKEENDILMENVLSIFDECKIIVRDYKIGEDLAKRYSAESENWSNDKPKILTMINSKQDKSIENNLRENLNDLKIKSNQSIEIINRDDTKIDFLRTYGVIFFVGIILSIAFLVSMALSVYYKLVTEAYEDVPRFNIMRKLGMTDDEAKSTIKKQMHTLLVLPIIFASVHTVFAFPILKKLLVLIGLMNTGLYIKVMIIVILVYIIIYLIILRVSEIAYTKIVLSSN